MAGPLCFNSEVLSSTLHLYCVCLALWCAVSTHRHPVHGPLVGVTAETLVLRTSCLHVRTGDSLPRSAIDLFCRWIVADGEVASSVGYIVRVEHLPHCCTKDVVSCVAHAACLSRALYFLGAFAKRLLPDIWCCRRHSAQTARRALLFSYCAATVLPALSLQCFGSKRQDGVAWVVTCILTHTISITHSEGVSAQCILPHYVF